MLWKLPKPTVERPHGFKYRLAYVREGQCVLRYDNVPAKAIIGTSALRRNPIGSLRSTCC
ncbi:MAG: DUF6516 family protein [Candidatus Binatia bacterium]